MIALGSLGAVLQDSCRVVRRVGFFCACAIIMTVSNDISICSKACIRLEIGIEIGLEFNQSEERRPI